MKTKVIVFWSSKLKSICYIDLNHNQILYKTELKKKPGKNTLEIYIKVGSVVPFLFYFTQGQHKTLFSAKEKSKIEKTLCRLGRMKRVAWWDIMEIQDIGEDYE